MLQEKALLLPQKYGQAMILKEILLRTLIENILKKLLTNLFQDFNLNMLIYYLLMAMIKIRH
jgi:hypothetical protein